MTRREEAIAKLKELIAEQRGRIDPKVLKEAQRAATIKQEGRAQKDLVPYDREAAAAAVALFLRDHDGEGDFTRKLQAMLDAQQKPRQ